MNRKLLQSAMIVGIVTMVYLFAYNLYYIIIYAQLADNGVKFSSTMKAIFALLIISTCLIIALFILSCLASAIIKNREKENKLWFIIINSLYMIELLFLLVIAILLAFYGVAPRLAGPTMLEGGPGISFIAVTTSIVLICVGLTNKKDEKEQKE